MTIGGSTKQCYNCTGTWNGCIQEPTSCPTNDLHKQCIYCNSSSEKECERDQYYQTCSSTQDLCMVYEQYDVRGVIEWIRKGCASSYECSRLNATVEKNCIFDTMGSRCTQCNQADTVCGNTPTIPMPCSGSPKCFKCNEDSIIQCNKKGKYIPCSDNDVCLEVKYRDKFGVLQSVVSDCSSNFVEYDSLQRNTDFSCPGTTEHIYNGSLGEYTCSNADRCGQEIANCTNPSLACRACSQTQNEDTCEDIAYDELCPSDDYVCVANFTRDQRGTIIGYSRGCVQKSRVPVCPTTKAECRSLGNHKMSQPASQCYTCDSTFGVCGEITTVAPSSCPVPGEKLSCLICDERGNTADNLCEQNGRWTPCGGPDVACLETKHRDPRGSLTRFTRQCTTRSSCISNSYTEVDKCVKRPDASETCWSCVATAQCKEEADLCPKDDMPLCYNCDTTDEDTCRNQHRKDADYIRCPKGKCLIVTKANKLGVAISYLSTCANSSCDESCTSSTDGSQTCKKCSDFVKCSGTTNRGNQCKPNEVLSCFTCRGSDKESCKNSTESGWVTCPHGNCITEYYENEEGRYEEYKMSCGRREQKCPKTKEERQGLGGWIKVTQCQKTGRCSCYGDDKTSCNDNDNDIFDTPLCPTCPKSHTIAECDAQVVYKECPSTYCINSIDEDKNKNIQSVEKYCSPDICQHTGIPIKTKFGNQIRTNTCTLYNDTLSGKSSSGGNQVTPAPTTFAYQPTTGDIDHVALRYNCTGDERLRCKTCRDNNDRTVCDYYETCDGMRKPICEIDRSRDAYTSRCVESYQCFPSQFISCEVPACKPKTYQVNVFVTIEAKFQPEYGVIGSRQWWSVCLTLMSFMDAFYRGIPGYVGITCGTMRAGSIDVEYFVHFDEPVTENTVIDVGKSTSKGLMKKQYSIKINNEMVNVTGNHVLLYESNNVTAYDFDSICEDLQLVCDDGQKCVFDNVTFMASCDGSSSGFSDLLPVVVPLSVLTPLAIIMVAVLVVFATRRARRKKEEEKSQIVADTMSRYHVSDTGTWSTIQRAFSPDYRSNWRSYIGSGFHGEAKEYAWDPDSASDITVHRNRDLAGASWNFTDFEGLRKDGPLTEDEELDDIFRIPRPALPGRTAERFPYRMPQFQGFRGLNRPMSFFGGSSEESR
ncbi:hypothetical protein LSH36_723g00029 [Paralvinella palmiformis]|uniref:Uncharacterized protein n=1 Tax=Paralvinella palmiformis TaxID=53620 RepID=A0AAD9J2P4_9ANNE|nr:hypothetical protein LSH36_723g00029 [Paralvinella palmiformis]